MTASPVNDTARVDSQLASAVSVLLRWGVTISAVLAAIGGVILLLQHGARPADYRTFRGEPDELTGIRDVIAGAVRGHGLAIAQLGLILLIATPIARVCLTFVAFVRRRDAIYAALTGIVMAILLFSLVAGGR